MAKHLFDSPEMRETIRRWLRARMAYKGVEYKELCARLAALGVVQNESNLRSKINNGSLGAQLFVYLLLALDTREMKLDEIREILDDVAGAAAAEPADGEAPPVRQE